MMSVSNEAILNRFNVLTLCSRVIYGVVLQYQWIN